MVYTKIYYKIYITIYIKCQLFKSKSSFTFLSRLNQRKVLFWATQYKRFFFNFPCQNCPKLKPTRYPVTIQYLQPILTFG